MNTVKNFYLSIVGLICFSLFGCSKNDTGTENDVKSETSISYIITISPDLLKFVTPQVKYIDENGNLITITGIEDLDRKVIENKAEIIDGKSSSSAWSSVVVTGTGYKCWTINMKFNRLNFHTCMEVKYLRKDFTEDITGNIYNFHHNVNTSIDVIKTIGYSTKAFSDTHMSVSRGNYKVGDDIEMYLDDLYKDSDKVGYYIDDNGDVTRKDDFNL